MAVGVERLDATRIRVQWARGGAVPALVEVRHFYRGLRGWRSHAPQTLTEVDPDARTGVVTLPELARGGTHYVLLRGYVLTTAGQYEPGEPRLFTVLELAGGGPLRRRAPPKLR